MKPLFIKLHRDTTEENVWVNFSHVSQIVPFIKYTRVCFDFSGTEDDCAFVDVRERAEDILMMIRDA